LAFLIDLDEGGLKVLQHKEVAAATLSNQQLPGTLEALNDALDRFMRPVPPAAIRFRMAITFRYFLHDAKVLMADPPIYRLAMRYTMQAQSLQHQLRHDIFDVRWEGNDVEVLTYLEEFELPEEQIAADAWPPAPRDPALKEAEARLTGRRSEMEQSLVSYLRAHIMEFDEIDQKVQIKSVDLRNLRLLDRAPAQDSVLVDLGVYVYHSYYEFPIVVEIAPQDGIETLGHRAYVAAEWQAADVGG
jgi:hypothetical protein